MKQKYVTHGHYMSVRLGTSLVVTVELGHPSSKSWDEMLVAFLGSRFLPRCIQLLKCRKSMMEHWCGGCGERLLSLVRVLSPVSLVLLWLELLVFSDC
jgi:hypothetical protein